VGDTLPLPLTVEIRDSRGRPVAGGTGGRVVNSVVGFGVTTGGGAMVSQSATVGADGRASSRWVLGGPAGEQQATAALATNIASVPFTATGTVAAADALVVVSGADQQGTAGAPLTDPVVVRVVDRFGNGIAGWTVDFTPNDAGASASPSSLNTDEAGLGATEWTLSPAEGAQTLTVSAAGITKGSPATVNATAVAAVITSLAKYEGDVQVGLVGKAVNIPPAVRVADQFGNGVAGVAVTFAVSVGAGSVTGAVDTTDANGIARVGSWVIDAAAGPNGLTASSAGFTPVEFSANGQAAAFNIVVRYFGSQAPTTAQQAAFTNAAARWTDLVFGDIDNVPATNLNLSVCAGADGTLSSINEAIDDIIIYAKVGPIDGAGNILGQAGPCYFRTGGSTPGLPLIGTMVFDEADLANLETSGQLGLVIIHEMAHVLGFGSFWNLTSSGTTYFNLVADTATADPYFTGAEARGAFDRVGGTGYVAGQKVPVENTGGEGTRLSHWRETVFDRELMTGFLDPGTNAPISIVTLGSLWDMRYLVVYANADAFAWPAPPALRYPGTALEMKDDMFQGPVYGVDPTGRVVGPFRRR
jgi:hypothetical protein